MTDQPLEEQHEGVPATGTEGSVVPQENLTGSQTTTPGGEAWQEGAEGSQQTAQGDLTGEHAAEAESVETGTTESRTGEELQDEQAQSAQSEQSESGSEGQEGEGQSESEGQSEREFEASRIPTPQQPFEQPTVPPGAGPVAGAGMYQAQARPAGEQILATGDPTPREVSGPGGRRITVPPGGYTPVQTPGGDIQPTEQRVHPVPRSTEEQQAQDAASAGEEETPGERPQDAAPAGEEETPQESESEESPTSEDPPAR